MSGCDERPKNVIEVVRASCALRDCMISKKIISKFNVLHTNTLVYKICYVCKILKGEYSICDALIFVLARYVITEWLYLLKEAPYLCGWGCGVGNNKMSRTELGNPWTWRANLDRSQMKKDLENIFFLNFPWILGACIVNMFCYYIEFIKWNLKYALISISNSFISNHAL